MFVLSFRSWWWRRLPLLRGCRGRRPALFLGWRGGRRPRWLRLHTTISSLWT